ncbi:MAG: family 10 glycosylhydrolase [Fimbriimonadia bacterium]|nr:family 10 glycosylhydrolase [Fimbriimonadia bacterium]
MKENVLLPSPEREFRGVWVASVCNIDWPSKPGLSDKQQQTELKRILDRSVNLNLNAIIFQVRPACDSLYESTLEPWSEFLSGRQGTAPSYDPLAFAISEAHARGLELHAWFNPFRAKHASSKSPLHRSHIARRHPELARKYGDQLWLDPSEPAAREHSLRVMLDVVKRYDVDGVHLDDYFYPYRIQSRGRGVEFPDDRNWQRYRQQKGSMSRADWRRSHINDFVKRLYHEIKHEKQWVKFGISPFGIWRPGNPPQVRGLDAYNTLYADARLWLQQGWVDYFAPQLYWKVDAPQQSYTALLKWWAQQNRQSRHLWIGNYTSKTLDGWSHEEILRKIAITRQHPGASGNIHFSMRALMNSKKPLSEKLCEKVYCHPALVPASPWLYNHAPAAPQLHYEIDMETNRMRLQWEAGEGVAIRRWVVAMRFGDEERFEIMPFERRAYEFNLLQFSARSGAVGVTAIDLYGNASEPAVVQLGSAEA